MCNDPLSKAQDHYSHWSISLEYEASPWKKCSVFIQSIVNRLKSFLQLRLIAADPGNLPRFMEMEGGVKVLLDSLHQEQCRKRNDKSLWASGSWGGIQNLDEGILKYTCSVWSCITKAWWTENTSLKCRESRATWNTLQQTQQKTCRVRYTKA